MTIEANKLTKFWQIMGSPRFLFFFIAIWMAVVLLSGIRVGDLSGYDDAVYAHEARAILQTGDWWTLSLNGNPDFDKPPLFIWLIAVSFKIFGVTDFAAKIPGVVLGWATAILVYFLTKELFADEFEDSSNCEWLAILSMFCLATTQYFLKYSSHAMTDVPFTFFFSLAIYFYVRGLKNTKYLLASGAAVGLSMLLRSPIGVFPLVIIILHLIYLRRFKVLFSPYFASLLLFAVAIPATWYLYEYNLFGELFISRHFNNVVAHSASTASRTNWDQFLWYFEYLFLLIKHYFPWFLPMPYCLYLFIGKLRKKSAKAESLLIIWLLVVLVPFSLAESKVLRYILPAFPVFSILSAYPLYEFISTKVLARISRFAVIILFLAAIIIAAFPNFQTRAEDMHAIAPISDAATKPDEKVLLYTSGALQWDYQNQLLWYGNRNCLLLKDKNEIEKLLSDKKEAVVIMDKTTFNDWRNQTNFQITILGESKNFICFRGNV